MAQGDSRGRGEKGRRGVSRNLGQITCDQCPSPVVYLLESPRPILEEEAAPYFREYEFMEVAKAVCPWCLAEYLAWVRWGKHGDEPTALGYFDLSYRSTFNDEPGDEDMAKRVVRVGTAITFEWETEPPPEVVERIPEGER